MSFLCLFKKPNSLYCKKKKNENFLFWNSNNSCILLWLWPLNHFTVKKIKLLKKNAANGRNYIAVYKKNKSRSKSYLLMVMVWYILFVSDVEIVKPKCIL